MTIRILRAMRPFALPAVAVLLVAVATSCRSAEPRMDYVVEPDAKYVALGDSYTAATNTGTRDWSDRCGRSLELPEPHRGSDRRRSHRQQLQRRGHDEPDRTTGTRRRASPAADGRRRRHRPGHDPAGCERLPALRSHHQVRIPVREPVRHALHRRRRATGADSRRTPPPDLQANLVEAFEEIQQRAPDARVIVIGYPQIAPDEGTCDLLPLPAGDYAYARRIIEGLNPALESAAAEQTAPATWTCTPPSRRATTSAATIRGSPGAEPNRRTRHCLAPLPGGRAGCRGTGPRPAREVGARLSARRGAGSPRTCSRTG